MVVGKTAGISPYEKAACKNISYEKESMLNSAIHPAGEQASRPYVGQNNLSLKLSHMCYQDHKPI